MNKGLIFLLLTFFISSHYSYSQEITMFPGFFGSSYYQDANQISKNEVDSLMLQDKEANQFWQKSKKHLTIAWIAIGAELGFLTWQLIRSRDNKSQTGPLIGVLASAGVALGYALSSDSLRKKAILTYNQNHEVSSILNYGFSNNGLGLVYQF